MKLLKTLLSGFKRLKEDEAGNTIVEMIMVMLLLVLFGATIYTLIFSGSETQAKILEEKNAQIEARIALSFVNVRLKQNDAAGAVFIRENPINGENAIVIKDTNYAEPLYTWIYWTDGVLKEALLFEEETVTDEPGMYTAIATVSGFTTTLTDDGGIVNKVTYTANGEDRTLTAETFLRSAFNEAEPVITLY